MARLAAASLLLTSVALGQNVLGPLDLGTHWAGREIESAQQDLSGYATLFVYWGVGPEFTKASPALVDLARRHADERFRIYVTAEKNLDWKPLLGTLWTYGMAWRPHNVTYTYGGGHAQIKPEKPGPYYILLDHRGKPMSHGADIAADTPKIDKVVADTPRFPMGPFPKFQKLADRVQAGKGFPKTLQTLDRRIESAKNGELKRDLFVLRAMLTRYKRDDLMRAGDMQVNEPEKLMRFIKSMQKMYAGTSFEADLNARASYLSRGLLTKSIALKKELERTIGPVRKLAPCDECTGLGVPRCQLHCVTCRGKHTSAFKKAREKLQKIYRKHDFDLRAAYADLGRFIEVIPEKDHPYPILIVMAEHIVLMGGVR